MSAWLEKMPALASQVTPHASGVVTRGLTDAPNTSPPAASAMASVVVPIADHDVNVVDESAFPVPIRSGVERGLAKTRAGSRARACRRGARVAPTDRRPSSA